MSENKIKNWIRINAVNLVAYGGLILCLIIFTVFPPMISGSSIWMAGPFKSIIKHATIYVIMSMGSMFVYSLGYMDISIGAQLSMYALFIILSIQYFGNMIPGLFISIVVAIFCGAINGAVAVFLHMPSVITSLFLQFLIYGINILITQKMGGGQYVSITISGTWLELFRQPAVLIAIMIGIALVTIYIYNYTRIGRYVKTIGANESFAVQSGVNTTAFKVIAYLILGVCIVVAALVYVGMTGTADAKAGSGMEMSVMLCLILGGMPLSGGMKSRMSSALIGAFTYTLLMDGLKYLNIEARSINIFVSVIFIGVILITCRKKGRFLPR